MKRCERGFCFILLCLPWNVDLEEMDQVLRGEGQCRLSRDVKQKAWGLMGCILDSDKGDKDVKCDSIAVSQSSMYLCCLAVSGLLQGQLPGAVR